MTEDTGTRRVDRLCTRCFTAAHSGPRYAAFRKGFIRDSVISPAGTAHQEGRGHRTFCGLDGTGWRWPTYSSAASVVCQPPGEADEA